MISFKGNVLELLLVSCVIDIRKSFYKDITFHVILTIEMDKSLRTNQIIGMLDRRQKLEIISVAVIGVIIIGIVALPTLPFGSWKGWYKFTLGGEIVFTDIELNILEFESAEINIHFTTDPSIDFQLDYYANNIDDLSVTSYSRGVTNYSIRGSSEVEILDITLTNDIIYEINIGESTNLSTTITYDENSLMDMAYFSYKVQGGTLDIIMMEETNFAGEDVSIISVWFSEEPDIVKLDIALHEDVGGYAFLSYTENIDLSIDGWYVGMTADGKYPDYATTQRSGYQLAIYVLCDLISGSLS